MAYYYDNQRNVSHVKYKYSLSAVIIYLKSSRSSVIYQDTTTSKT